MNELAQKKCKPCEEGAAPLKGEALTGMLQKLGGGWNIVNGDHLEKLYSFKNFRQALEFTNQIGETAEDQGHHPDITLGWGKVKVAISTHSIGGLSENDFILAARIDQIQSS
ncbi:MAG TPA: 4a-hydroxytetrahydrobiopterin dehydratase [Methylomirabilota bacterium]|nr:4a-hydroxytetrahydrobiopterin dehydratase [Methylomirabilota bacterium]